MGLAEPARELRAGAELRVVKQSVDFKCELRDPELARLALKHLGGAWAENRAHRDTYFRVATGHVKRTEAEGDPIEYVVYERREQARPTLSRFTILNEDEKRERYGERELPVWMVLEKEREIWLYEGVRVHIDQVKGLGWFLEIDALVSRQRNVLRCYAVIERVRDALKPALGGAVAGSYADMLSRDRAEGDAA